MSAIRRSIFLTCTEAEQSAFIVTKIGEIQPERQKRRMMMCVDDWLLDIGPHSNPRLTPHCNGCWASRNMGVRLDWYLELVETGC